MAILFSEEEFRPISPGGLGVVTGILAGTTTGAQANSHSMAVPVTRHASTPPVEYFQLQQVAQEHEIALPISPSAVCMYRLYTHMRVGIHGE